MYAQSDNQRVRQWYLGDTLYFEGKEYEKWWKQSPIAYIKNAKTPTMIHVVDGDPRVPRPQSEEMHMALKRLGVPTELFVYPGATHGIRTRATSTPRPWLSSPGWSNMCSARIPS